MGEGRGRVGGGVTLRQRGRGRGPAGQFAGVRMRVLRLRREVS